MQSRSARRAYDLEPLDAVNVCLLPEHKLNTIVDMVDVLGHKVIALVFLGSLGEGSQRCRNADSDN